MGIDYDKMYGDVIKKNAALDAAADSSALDAVRSVADFAAKLDAAEPLAVDALAEIAADVKSPAAARVAAANALLDRKRGKAPQAIDVSQRVDVRHTIEESTREMIDRFAEFALRRRQGMTIEHKPIVTDV